MANNDGTTNETVGFTNATTSSTNDTTTTTTTTTIIIISSSYDVHLLIRIILSSISCALSIMGSLAVIWISYRRTQWKKKVYNRLVSLLSVCDIMFTLSIFLQIFMMKSDLLSDASTRKDGTPRINIDTFGTHATCAIVGFLTIHFDLSVSLANCMLSLYFVCRVCYGWQDIQIAKNLEKPAMLITLLSPLLLGIPALATTSINYNTVASICWFSQYPTFCGTEGADYTECTRGRVLQYYLAFVFVGATTITSLIGFFGTSKVYVKVKATIEASRNHSFEFAHIGNRTMSNTTSISRRSDTRRNNSDSMTKRLNDVSRQAISYSLVYANTCFWPFVLTLGYHAVGYGAAPPVHVNQPKIMWLEYLVAIFYPLQGFLNFLVFTRPNVQRWGHLYPDKSIWWALKMELQSDPPTTTRRRQSTNRNNNNNHVDSSMMMFANTATGRTRLNDKRRESSSPPFNQYNSAEINFSGMVDKDNSGDEKESDISSTGRMTIEDNAKQRVAAAEKLTSPDSTESSPVDSTSQCS